MQRRHPAVMAARSIRVSRSAWARVNSRCLVRASGRLAPSSFFRAVIAVAAVVVWLNLRALAASWRHPLTTMCDNYDRTHLLNFGDVETRVAGLPSELVMSS